MIKVVIFDFDGTVADTLPLCIAAFREAVEPLAGKQVSDAEIVATFGPSEEGTIMSLVPDRFEEGLAAYLRHYSALHDMCPATFDGMREIIDYIKQRGIRVALVTGKGRLSCDISLAYYGMEDVFDIVATGGAEGECKAANIRRVLDSFGFRPDEAVYVGDSPSDIRSSREAGVPVVSALWGSFTEPDKVMALAPDEVFHTVEEFGEYIRRNL